MLAYWESFSKLSLASKICYNGICIGKSMLGLGGKILIKSCVCVCVLSMYNFFFQIFDGQILLTITKSLSYPN